LPVDNVLEGIGQSVTVRYHASSYYKAAIEGVFGVGCGKSDVF
jgi:hypothetical protein